MAKKADAKAAKVVASASKKQDYKAMSAHELNETLISTHQDLLVAKSSLKSGELVNPRVLGEHRKNVARIMTQINTKQVAAIAAPAKDRRENA
jgi:ribosomal protein L29